MNQVEIVRAARFRPAARAVEQFLTAPVRAADRGRHAGAAPAPGRADPRRRFRRCGLSDDSLEMIRDQFRKFAEDEVKPFAHGWHERDELIPLPVIEHLAELGVFGLTIPEEFGGLGPRQGGDVRRHRGAEPRLYRRGLARHPHRDRGRADPPRRHRRAEGLLAAEASPRARSCRPPCSPSPTSAPTSPRSPPAPCSRTATGEVTGAQDLDHPRRPRRPDDAAGPHRPGREGLSRACRCCWPRSRAAPTPTPSRSTA